MIRRCAGPGRSALPLRDRGDLAALVVRVGGAWCYFQALRGLPLAEATAVLFVFPLLLTVLAAWSSRSGSARGAGRRWPRACSAC